MKKTLAILLIFLLIFALFSCGEEPSAEKMLSEFATLYGMEGVIYSPEKAVGEQGYIPKGLFERAYLYSGEIPKNFAVIFNSHTHKGSEAAIFVCSDENEKAAIIEAVSERCRTICENSENVVIITSGLTVAYSTAENPTLAKELLHKIISHHS